MAGCKSTISVGGFYLLSASAIHHRKCACRPALNRSIMKSSSRLSDRITDRGALFSPAAATRRLTLSLTFQIELWSYRASFGWLGKEIAVERERNEWIASVSSTKEINIFMAGTPIVLLMIVSR